MWNLSGLTDGLWWPVLTGNWLSCTGCWLYSFTKCFMYGILFLHVSSSVDGHFVSKNGLDRLSNWLSLRCLGPWMNLLLTEWWSTFVCTFLNGTWCFFGIVEGNFLLISFLYSCFLYITQVLTSMFPLKWWLLFRTVTLLRRSLYSFECMYIYIYIYTHAQMYVYMYICIYKLSLSLYIYI